MLEMTAQTKKNNAIYALVKEIIWEIRGIPAKEKREPSTEQLERIKANGIFDAINDGPQRDYNLRYTFQQLEAILRVADTQYSLLWHVLNGNVDEVLGFLNEHDRMLHERRREREMSRVVDGRTVGEWQQLIHEGKATSYYVYVAHVDQDELHFKLLDVPRVDTLFADETEEDLAERGL